MERKARRAHVITPHDEGGGAEIEVSTDNSFHSQPSIKKGRSCANEGANDKKRNGDEHEIMGEQPTKEEAILG